MPEYERELPERRYFRRPASLPRTHHLHAVVRGGSFWQRHLAFRNALRAWPDRARAYAQLKRRLAVQFGPDRDGYTTAKSDFIASVLEEAGWREPRS